MRRRFIALFIGASLLAATVVEVTATTANASPETQSHAYGVQSSWSATWSGNNPFWVRFYYGDGESSILSSTNTTSRNYTHTYWPCSTTNYNPQLRVTDDNEDTATDTVAAQEGGGPQC